jgi:hypothetical protein
VGLSLLDDSKNCGFQREAIMNTPMYAAPHAVMPSFDAALFIWA